MTPSVTLHQVMKNISRLLIVTALAVGFPTTQRFGLGWQTVLATLGGCGFAGYGYRKASLSPSGDTLAWNTHQHVKILLLRAKMSLQQNLHVLLDYGWCLHFCTSQG